MLTILIGVLEQGLIYAILALGVYVTYKILDFPDLSVDGTFPLGGAVTAELIIAGVNPVLTLFISFIVGALAGVLTGLIHVKLKVRDLLSGIIMMTALYSINLRIAGANVPIFSKESIFENKTLDAVIPEAFKPYLVLPILLIIVVIMKVLLDLYLKTKSGYLLRAVGDNDTLVTSLAKDKGMVKIVGLAIANAFVALAGSVYAQEQGFLRYPPVPVPS
jgi:putative ABC transport system permease protein